MGRWIGRRYVKSTLHANRCPIRSWRHNDKGSRDPNPGPASTEVHMSTFDWIVPGHMMGACFTWGLGQRWLEDLRRITASGPHPVSRASYGRDGSTVGRIGPLPAGPLVTSMVMPTVRVDRCEGSLHGVCGHAHSVCGHAHGTAYLPHRISVCALYLNA